MAEQFKLKRINVEGLEVNFNHGLPILVMDGYTDKSTVNHFINFASEAGAAIDKEMTEMKDNQCLVVLPLSKTLSRISVRTNKRNIVT